MQEGAWMYSESLRVGGKTHQWGGEQMGGVVEVAEAKGFCLPASWA